MHSEGKLPILKLSSFCFTVLHILASPTSDPFPFIQWLPITKVLNRDQPPVRMKERLCKAMNTTCSDLVCMGLVKIKGKLSLAEPKRLLISATPSIESLGNRADPKEYMWSVLVPLYPCEQSPSYIQICFSEA